MVFFMVCSSGDDIGAALRKLVARGMGPGRRRALHGRRVRARYTDDNQKAAQNRRTLKRYRENESARRTGRFWSAALPRRFFEQAKASARMQ